MSLLVAIPCALAAAVAYGASTAVEHSAAHTGDAAADTRGLVALIRNPRWLLGMAGDTLGLLLQVVALATGPVVLIQPLLVLALPVSLPIAWWLGGPRPGLAQARACLWMIAGLCVFFGLLGDPGSGNAIGARATLLTFAVMAAAGVAALIAVAHRARPVKAAVYGAVAGAWFGFVAVLLDAAATAWDKDGLSAFGHTDGLTVLVTLVVLGAASITLTQASFQIGALAASFPANLAADPVAAVILGSLLLHENLPLSPMYVFAYVVCLGAIVFGSICLAADPGTSGH